jgi:16S rRNA (cytosine1402-N4)-methyltransferase
MTRGSGAEGASQGPAEKLPRHIPVLVSEVLETLAPKDGETYVDGTFGAGGYTRAILAAANCSVLALDRDPTAIANATVLLEEAAGRLKVIQSPFSQMEEAVRENLADAQVDGVVLDIGVSSMQLDDAERGFSFQSDGPLDMRMSSSGMSAADFLNTAEEEEIANVIYTFGEERRSRAIARAIVRRRDVMKYTRTLELAETVSRVFHGRKIDGRHPATRTFQALRIFVNDELGELANALSAAERILKPGGRLVVVSFHSLEDRIVKKFLVERGGKAPGGSRHLPQESIKSRAPSFLIVNSRPLTPSKGELEVNPRARSARLRAATRTEAAVWPLDLDAMGVPRNR